MQIMKLDSRAIFLEWGDFAPGDIWQYLKTFLLSQLGTTGIQWEVRAGFLLNILQCSGQVPKKK